MLHLYESLFRAGYGEHPERFLSKDELDDYRASLSYYNSQYLELLAMLNTEQSVLFKKLQDNRSDIIGLEREEAGELYKAFGKAMDKLPDTWRVYVLSSHPDFERCYGRFADKKRKLYNGMLKCDLFMYGKRL